MEVSHYSFRQKANYAKKSSLGGLAAVIVFDDEV
jgi:hypothetical protein